MRIILGLIPIVLIALIVGCSPKIILNKSSESLYPKVEYGEPFALLEEDTVSIADQFLLGKIRFRKQGYTVNCDYKAVIRLAVNEAKSIGGNCLVITEHKVPEIGNTCHRIKGTVYRIPNPKKYESLIYWSENRKLSIEDFKGRTEKRPFQAATASSIRHFGRSNNTSSKKTITIESLFYCNKSYFKRSNQDSLVLIHEQLHFDITEIYRRKCVKKILDERINFATFYENHEKIFSTIISELQLKQDEYDSEVYADRSKQKKWNDWVRDQLNVLEDYKKNELEVK